jgi:chemotaxis family two-component system response regulator PixG
MIMLPDPQQTRPLVAIVDDEVDITTYLSVALEDHGYQVVACNDAERAVESLAGSRPDVILLDLLMPLVTGVSLYGALAAHPALRETPIVILSGLDVRHELPDLLREGGDLPPPRAFIDKPVDVEEVLLVLEEVVGRPAEPAP